MRTIALFAIVILMSIVVSETAAAQTLPAPQAVTDPKQIASKPNAQVEPRSLTIEKLYMTRQVGRPTWSPDGKSIAFISNMSGRNNLWLVPAEGGWPVQLTVSDQRQTAPAWSPRRKMDRLSIRLRRRRTLGYFSGLAEDRQSRQPHQHARDRGNGSDVVARRPLPGVSGKAKNIGGP
jgi:dipeptidyl aminopeptidase/acylaminoacyl peptidase